MNDMTKTKCSFIISVQCPHENCGAEMKLKSNTFLHENMVSVECSECKKAFIAKNIDGGMNENT